MVLKYLCPICGKENQFDTKKPTRGDLQMKIGDEVNVNCKSCGNNERIHLNKIFARADNRILFFGVLLGILLTVILVMKFGFIAAMTMTIPILIWVYENKNAHNFNRYKIRRK